MNTASVFNVRKMTRAEFDVAVDWAAAEGWNPGLHDADLFWASDPDGFLVMEHEGEAVACGSIVSYGGKFGFMGFFIVRPDWRGKGLGATLWFKRRDTLLSRLDAGAAIGMDGVFNMQSFYSRGGFQFAHRNLRMEGVGRHFEYDNSCVGAIAAADIDEVLALDRRCFGFDRSGFMRDWLAQPESLAVCYKESGALRGFGVIRRARRGWKIGPLFCQTSAMAEQIFCALNVVAVGEPIFLDIPEANQDAVRLSEKFDLTESFGCARMYYGAMPTLPLNEIFGITSFELG